MFDDPHLKLRNQMGELPRNFTTPGTQSIVDPSFTHVVNAVEVVMIPRANWAVMVFAKIQALD